MLRGIIVWILLIPMLSNGLWIVCRDSSEATAIADSLTQSEKDCIRICLKKFAAEFGTICLALPGNTKNPTSIAVVDFGVAVLPLDFLSPPVTVDTPLFTGPSARYTAPSLANDTPPPRAPFHSSVQACQS